MKDANSILHLEKLSLVKLRQIKIEKVTYTTFILYQEKGCHMQYALAILAGLIVGVVFSAIKLPLPAPPTLVGVLGIIGIYLGYRLYETIIGLF